MRRISIRRNCISIIVMLALIQSWMGVWGSGVRELEVKWTFNTSEQFPGKSFGAGHQGCITVWGTDGDGVNEVLFGTRRGDSKRLWCLSAYGMFKWLYPPITEDGLPGDPTSKVSIVDVNSDGVYELCFAGRGGRLHVLNPDGSVMWTWDEPNRQNMHGAPQAYDVDGDGYVEFFLNTNDGFIHRVNHLGDLVWTSSQAGKGNQGQPTICDVDQDGLYESIHASQDFNVYCLDAGTGYEKWRFDMAANMETNQVIVADINKDGEYEVLAWVGPPTSSVICISPYGIEIWRWTLPRFGISIRLCQAIGDLDEDGSMDMVIMTGDAAYGIDIGGEKPETKWELNFTAWGEEGIIPRGAMANSWTSYQTIADLDGDDSLEVLWLVPFPVITDAATGEPEAYYLNNHIARNRRAEDGGWFGDVDGDGISEFICDLNGNSHPETMVYCLTMGGKFPAKSPWPEYYHSAYPAEYQNEQEWLTLKAAGSNSLWFPIDEIPISYLMLALLFGLGTSNWIEAKAD